VLAQDCHANCDLPGFPTSAMDGWAVCGPGPWQITGDVPAGQPLARELVIGEAVRIATGAVVPAGADAILRWEQASRSGETLSGDVEPGRDIRTAGEECRRGELMASAGTIITPALAGLLAATGHDVVAVRARPRVAVLLLGDELLVTGVPTDGRVRDSLGPQIPGWIARAGGIVVAQEHVPDAVAATQAALARHMATSDLIITTGGTAAGPRDHLHAALAGLTARVHVDRVRVKPGHPMLLADLPDGSGESVPVVGLPGNPHSAVVGLVTLVIPLLDGMLGRPPSALPRVPTRDELRGSSDHTRLVAGRLIDGVFTLSPYPGSAMLRGLAQSDGFAVVRQTVEPDMEVDWLTLP
jgi:molybdopterin molybdotransferase